MYRPPIVETLDEFRFAAHCIRDLETAWRALREGEAGTIAEFLTVVDLPECSPACCGI
jgi:hypothetical protein